MQVLEFVSQPAEQKASPKITLSLSQRTVADVDHVEKTPAEN